MNGSGLTGNTRIRNLSQYETLHNRQVDRRHAAVLDLGGHGAMAEFCEICRHVHYDGDLYRMRFIRL